MNTKHKINFKFLWGIIAICLAVAFSSILFNFDNKKSIKAAMPEFNQNLSENQGFTAVDVHGIIFSIEKVAVAWGEEADGVTQTTKKLTDEDAITLAGGGSGKEIYFKPTIREGFSRYGVSNNEYVMLKENSGIQSNVGETNETLTETIVISFGQYYFENSGNNRGNVLQYVNGVDESSGTGAGIMNISSIVINYEGSTITSDTQTFGEIYHRTYDNQHGDFAYVLPKDAPEGRYSVMLRYRYGDETYDQPAVFNFTLLREQAYIATIEEQGENGNQNKYSARPSLTLGSAVDGAGGQVGTSGKNYNYTLGESENYPTLTYDYTRYKLSYTHSSYKITTDYDVSFNFDAQNPNLTFTASRLQQQLPSDQQLPAYYLNNFHRNDNNHLVTIVFTDLGDYNFNFKYIYRDNNSVIDNLSVDGFSLHIGGVQDLYARQSANVQFKYIKFAANSSVVDLIVPNGYTDKENPQANKIYYTTNENDEKTKTTRVGNTIETLDTNLGKTIKADGTDKTTKEWAEMFFGDNSDNKNLEELKKFVSNIDYKNLTTNLGSIKFKTNYEINYTKSFYFKADDAGFVGEIFADDGASLKLNENNRLNYTSYNETTFLNNVGYYIVFIYINDGDTENDGSYHIFAYKYNQEGINAQIKDEDGNPLRENGFSSKNVYVSWQKEGVFEKEIVVRYATSTTSALEVSGPEQYVYGNYTYLNYTEGGCILGDGVGSYLHYQLEITCEGISSVSYHFTIDRSAISGVNLYKTEITTNQFGHNVYQYLYQNGERVSADQNTNYAITSGSFALDWNAKPSGALISAQYLFVPFTAASDSQVKKITSGEMDLITNGYEAIFAADKIQQLSFANSGLRIVDRQGIYLFILTDAAGNETSFMYVLDSTPAYLEVDGNDLPDNDYLFGEMKTYSNSTLSFGAGTHKAILLKDFSGLDTSNQYVEELKNIITNSYSGNYYNGANNKERITNLFTTNGDQTYLIVKNNSVLAYDSNNQIDNNTSLTNISNANKTGTMTYVKSASTSMVRTLYIIGENNLGALISDSYSILEINLDNSRGEAYFSNLKIDITNEVAETSKYFSTDMRLQTGSDDQNAKINGIMGAEATRDNFVYFTWLMGTADTEVGKITYKHYTLNLQGETFNESTYDEKHFYYSSTGDEVVLYDKNGQGGKTFNANAGTFNNSQNGYALINPVKGQTLEGLYEITRTYSGNGKEGDPQTLNYYFIVDRHGIISLGENIGADIYLGLFNNQIKFNSFGAVITDKLLYTPTGQTTSKTITYPVYLNQDATLKLPATINVPIYKYFKASDYSNNKLANYPANNLYISVYFVDRYLQLPAEYNQLNNRGLSKLLFEYNSFTHNDSFIDHNGYFKIDLTQQLDNILQQRFIHTQGQNSWLTLPGDYVVIISDNTVSSLADSNTQVIGFRINTPVGEAGAKAEIATLYENDEVTTTNHVINTNKTNIKVTIAKPDNESLSAQTEPNYIVVEQRIIESGRQDIVYTYKNEYGTITNAGASFVDGPTTEEGNTVIHLNCGNLNPRQSVTFTITVRWTSEMDGNNPLFQNSYFYYNGNQVVNYFESVYTINVDRVAPSTNINTLLTTEEKPRYNFFDGDIIIDSEVGGNKVKVYNTYNTDNRDASKIYAFRVTPSTPFSVQDIQYVYLQKLDVASNVQLFDLNLLSSNNIALDAERRTISRYAEILQDAGYYEIVERDYAGNLTQYVVFFDDNNSEYNYVTNLQLNVHTSLNEESYSPYTFNSQNSQNINANTLNLDGEQPIATIQTAFDTMNGVFDRFYGFELSSLDRNGDTQFTFDPIKTNLTTKFTQNDLAKQVVDLFKDENSSFVYGNYRLDIYTRVGVNTFYINLYRTNLYTIDASSLVVVENGNYMIDFSMAKVDDGDQFYYATEIVLMGGDNYQERTFKMRVDRNYQFFEVVGVDENGEDLYSRNPTNTISNLHGEYILIVTTLGNKKSSHPFDTSGNTEFKNIEFASNYYYDAATDIYYTLEQTSINYNTMVYSVQLNYTIANEGNIQPYSYDVGYTQNLQIYYDNQVIIEVMPGVDDNDINGRVIIYPYFKNLVGELLSVNVSLIYKNNWDAIDDEGYNIVIDNRTAQVSLTDADGVQNGMTFAYNPTEINNTKYDSIDVANGSLYLKYVPLTEQTATGISYTYQLRVEENDGQLTTIAENNKIFTINPSLDNTGIYRFIITINYVEHGETNFLGRVVYTFCVEKNTGVYTPFVVQADAKILQPNKDASITLEDILSDFGTNEDEIKSKIAHDIYLKNNKIDEQTVKSEIHLPQRIEDIYIRNGEIDVLPYGNYNNFGEYSETIYGYKFTLYRLNKDGVEYYIATLIAPNTKNFIQINDNYYEYNGVYVGESYNLTITNTAYSEYSDKIIPKLNTTFVTVSHYGEEIYTKPIGDYGSGQDIVYSSAKNGEATITIIGSGRFNLKFTDLAGNTNWFSFTDSNTDYESLALTLLNNDVAVMVNGQAIIDKAIYGEQVTISIPSRDAYAAIGANINGLELRYRYNNPSSDAVVVPYTTLAQNGAYSYTFTSAGWYSVELVCPYIDSTRGELRTVLEFTIVEPTEAYETFNFGRTRAEQIVRVTNRDNMSAQEIADLTEVFKTILEQNNYKLDYATIVSPEYVDVLGLNTTLGRQQFNITYRVDNGIYPAREASFTLSLNNSIPAIGCSLNAGDGSTKGFTISYNLGEIYNQVGLSGIYVYKDNINDDSRLVLHLDVNEASENAITSTKISRRGDADDGNYYVVLKTASGRIVSSYGVKITQPLNTWAIIVIVVVSLIVIAIVVTVILLRTKMKIR